MSGDLRSEFPVFERVSYLNAGSVGPTPLRAAEAAIEELRAQGEGRYAGTAQFERQVDFAKRLLTRAAELLGADAAEVALREPPPTG